MPIVCDDFCPKCGNWVASLDEETGWCFDCTPPRLKPFDWFSEHADSLDRKLVQGITLKEAIKQVADEVRPICLSCGTQIARGIGKKYGNRGQTLFCTKKAQCRLARRRYSYYKHELGMTQEKALELVLDSLQVPSKKAQAA